MITMKANRGFTLIELMIAVAVVAILASIAYPSYKDHVYKGRRAEGKAALLQAASRQEQYYTDNNGYAQTLTNLGYSSATPLTENRYYQLVIVDDNDETTQTSFMIKAVPLGDQSNDSCGDLTLDHLGNRGAGAANCW